MENITTKLISSTSTVSKDSEYMEEVLKDSENAIKLFISGAMVTLLQNENGVNRIVVDSGAESVILINLSAEKISQ